MELQGKNLLSADPGGAAPEHHFQAFAPALGMALEPAFEEASASQIDAALQAAHKAFSLYRALTAETVAAFLDRIAFEIVSLGDALLLRAHEETALPRERLLNERGRTTNQLKMFADLLREGSWVEASIDRAKPPAKPDLRRMLQPLGPVVVFGASNFPLAFSVAGGDTASALAARCPVIVKAHPAHPGTSELVGRAILTAAKACGIPEGVFALLHGRRNEVGLGLVRHPLTQAVAFTGSLRGGRALFDAASLREKPIPVFAEMGSVNPVFLLPGAIQEKAESIADGLFRSVTLGVGQFCTCPGVVVALQDEGFARLKKALIERLQAAPSGSMLTPEIARSYQEGLREFSSLSEASLSPKERDEQKAEACPAIFSTDAQTFLKTKRLQEELFGPSTVLVACQTEEELFAVVENLEGELTASVHGTSADLARFASLLPALAQKVGRLIFDGYPTGVEVCPSMHHGGPYPAATMPHFTSVGTSAIKRFVRPVCYQNAPEAALPIELQNQNLRKIWRLIDNQLTQEDV